MTELTFQEKLAILQAINEKKIGSPYIDERQKWEHIYRKLEKLLNMTE